MTGFGLGKSHSSQSHIEVSLRAVNGRFLEPRFHLPREFIAFEGELKKILEKVFDRGTLDIFVSRKIIPGATPVEVVVNKDLVKKYYKAYAQIAKELKTKLQIHAESIARLPDVVRLEEFHEPSNEEKKALLEAMKKACEEADKERSREGKGLRGDLESLLNSLESEVTEILGVREEVNQNLLARFEQKIKARLSGVEIDPSRLSQEVVMQVEKSDINEEVTRLREHIRNYKKLLDSTGAIGKKLDFYTQELLREVNTIGSKSSVSKLTQIVVQAKTLIERLREQVQNVE
jgi:uncharacterized protein (TIGR00255 family)